MGNWIKVPQKSSFEHWLSKQDDVSFKQLQNQTNQRLLSDKIQEAQLAYGSDTLTFLDFQDLCKQIEPDAQWDIVKLQYEQLLEVTNTKSIDKESFSILFSEMFEVRYRLELVRRNPSLYAMIENKIKKHQNSNSDTETSEVDSKLDLE